MPRKYSRKYKRRRRMVRRRRRTFRPQKTLLGNSRVVRLSYVTMGQIPTLLGIPGSISIRAAGAGSPFPGGGQPRGWNELSTFWTHYVVLGARIKIQFMPGSEPGEDVRHPIICYMALQNTPSQPVLSARSAMEDRNTASKAWTPGQRTVTLFKNYSCRKFFGVKDPSDNIARLGAQTTGANVPPDDAFFTFSVSPTHGLTVPDTDFVVQVSYIIKYTEPRQPGPSN